MTVKRLLIGRLRHGLSAFTLAAVNATARTPVLVYLYKRPNPLSVPGLPYTYEMTRADDVKGHSVHLKLSDAIKYAKKHGLVPTQPDVEGFPADIEDLTAAEWLRVRKIFKLDP